MPTVRLRLALYHPRRLRRRRAGGAGDLSRQRARSCCPLPTSGRSGRPWSAGPSRSPITPASASPTRTSAAAPCWSSSASRYCPDVCPSALQVIAAALDKLGPKAESITPVFITSTRSGTRRRSSPAYVKSFHPRLVGPDRHAGRDRGGHQGLSRLCQEGARSQIDGRLHDRPFLDHLRHGTGRRLPHATSPTPPASMPWPSASPSCCRENTAL